MRIHQLYRTGSKASSVFHKHYSSATMSTIEGWHTCDDGEKLYTKTWKVLRHQYRGGSMRFILVYEIEDD